MTESSLNIDRTDEGDLRYVERLLKRAELPTEDVRADSARFYVARNDGERVGVGGIEIYDGDGLLRSVAVEESVRGLGHGTAIVAALEAEARDTGVERLYLLTTTASEFFADRGYAEIDRADAPETIRDTTEFVELCPSTAICLGKPL